MWPRVKIRTETSGARADKPNFGLLKEGLRMVQRTTPTAIASIEARVPNNHGEAIVGVFAGSKGSEELGPCSFHSGLPSLDRDRRQI